MNVACSINNYDKRQFCSMYIRVEIKVLIHSHRASLEFVVQKDLEVQRVMLDQRGSKVLEEIEVDQVSREWTENQGYLEDKDYL